MSIFKLRRKQVLFLKKSFFCSHYKIHEGFKYSKFINWLNTYCCLLIKSTIESDRYHGDPVQLDEHLGHQDDFSDQKRAVQNKANKIKNYLQTAEIHYKNID